VVTTRIVGSRDIVSAEKDAMRPSHTRLPDDPNWKIQAPCRREFWPDMWFPERACRSARRAKRVCADECPVRVMCGRYALRTHERFGIWAGFDVAKPRELAALTQFVGRHPA
jgi:WhiB family redox-sensing transcriptional regulator